jgi:ribosomal protein L7/L12
VIEDFLMALRAQGHSRIQSIRALREREGCSLAEAKEI